MPRQTSARMKRLVAQWRRSGESQAGFSRRHGIPPWTFWYWSRKLATSGVAQPSPAFVSAMAHEHDEGAQVCALALERTPPGADGWPLPVEPLLRPTVHRKAGSKPWAATLAALRARDVNTIHRTLTSRVPRLTQAGHDLPRGRCVEVPPVRTGEQMHPPRHIVAVGGQRRENGRSRRVQHAARHDDAIGRRSRKQHLAVPRLDLGRRVEQSTSHPRASASKDVTVSSPAQ